jgi:hypothetical protein
MVVRRAIYAVVSAGGWVFGMERNRFNTDPAGSGHPRTNGRERMAGTPLARLLARPANGEDTIPVTVKTLWRS